VTATAATTRDVYTDAGELRGVWTRGGEPKELVLSNGSRLTLQEGERGQVRWRLHDAREGERAVSYEEALELAGDEFSGYVRVRTRAEAEWLRAVADWCGSEAERLEHESDGQGRNLA
jgi:hypothetical protein